MIGKSVFTALLAALLLPPWSVVRASEVSWAKFEVHLQACSDKHGYNRKRSGNLGDHELGRGERAWRECAYDGVRSILIPGSGLDGAYRRVIVQDKVMTDKVANGDMARGERQARLEKLVAQLHAAEEQRAPQEMDKMHAQFMARMHEMRRMQRLNGIMR